MTEQPPKGEYRIEDLAHLSGATVRTIRAYQERGLLPRPERRGRANVYGDTHLARLRQIADLLDRGYSLASIKELLEAWDAGLDLGGVLGLVAEIDGPWTDEKASCVSRPDLDTAFGAPPTRRRSPRPSSSASWKGSPARTTRSSSPARRNSPSPPNCTPPASRFWRSPAICGRYGPRSSTSPPASWISPPSMSSSPSWTTRPPRPRPRKQPPSYAGCAPGPADD